MQFVGRTMYYTVQNIYLYVARIVRLALVKREFAGLVFEHAAIAERSYKRVGHTVRHLYSTVRHLCSM